MKIVTVSVLLLAFHYKSSFAEDLPNIFDDSTVQKEKRTNGTNITINGNVSIQVFNNLKTCCNEKNTTDTHVPPNIPNDYKVIIKDVNYTTAVKLHPPGPNWNEARKTCFHEGGFLAYASSKEEEDIYVQIMSDNQVSNIWIGIHDFFKQGDYTTVLGEVASEVAYIKWRPDQQPDNYKGFERCLHLNHNLRGLNDINCDKTDYAFICKIKRTLFL